MTLVEKDRRGPNRPGSPSRFLSLQNSYHRKTSRITAFHRAMKFLLNTVACFICLESLVEGSDEKSPRITSIQSPLLTKTKKSSILSSLFTNRVVGGTDADDGEYPFMVWGAGCGGSLVAPDVVLSASHCEGAFDRFVRIGSIYPNKEGQEVVTDKSQEVLYPRNGDIMLIKLKEEVTVPTMKINFDPLYPPEGGDTPLKIIGFGALDEGGQAADRLQEATVGYIDHEVCDASYGDLTENIMLCAGFMKGGIDTCQGDSGGPVFDANNVVVGVTSFGQGCARPSYPGVYARTSGFSSWLKENICKMATTKPDYCGTNKGDVNVRITLTTDDYPRETSLSLVDSQGRVILNKYTGDISRVASTLEYQANVEAGAYKLIVSDSESDGLCCDYGEGKVDVFENGKLIISSDGKFSNVEVLEFTVGEADGGGGGDDGDEDEVKYYIDYKLDDTRKENLILVKDSATNGKVFKKPGKKVTANTPTKKYINLTPGEGYKLEVRDSEADGLSGGGYVQVMKEEGTSVTQLARIAGTFNKKKKKKNFTA